MQGPEPRVTETGNWRHNSNSGKVKNAKLFPYMPQKGLMMLKRLTTMPEDHAGGFLTSKASPPPQQKKIFIFIEENP